MENISNKRQISYSENKFALTTLSNLTNIQSRHLTTKLVLNTQKNDLKKHLLFKTPTSKAAAEVKNQKRRTPLGAASSSILNDRYIPNRVGTNMEISYHLLQQPKTTKSDKIESSERDQDSDQEEDTTNAENNFVDSIKKRLIIDTCNGVQEKAKVLNLHRVNTADCSSNSLSSNSSCESFIDMKTMYSNSLANSMKKCSQRVIHSSPERILDAPDFRNDYCKLNFDF
jgi:hypothetical protein